MKRYDNIVLNRLIDSYENSAAYRADHYGSSAADGDKLLRRRGVFCHIDKKSFPDYFDTASGTYETLHEQLLTLEQKGLIRLYWRSGISGHILEKAALEVKSADNCYQYLKRKPRWKKEAEIAEICRKYRELSAEQYDKAENTAILTAYLGWIMRRLENGESVKRFADIDDPSGFDRSCRLLLSILTNDRELYLRQFSIEVFNDSKTAEKELEKAVSVIKEFSSDDIDYAGFSSDQILEGFGIYRNPVWMYMKGHAVIGIDNKGDTPDAGSLNLGSLENGIGVTLRDLASIIPDPSDPPECILTVENLTSYYRQDAIVAGKKALVIYLGGFAGRQKRDFLAELHKAFPDAVFRHSGDIDCGGFRIWKSLCEGTGIPFATYDMDVETFRKYADNGRPLTGHDRTTLEMMKEDPFYKEQRELFDLMLRTGIKLEQESFV